MKLAFVSDVDNHTYGVCGVVGWKLRQKNYKTVVQSALSNYFNTELWRTFVNRTHNQNPAACILLYDTELDQIEALRDIGFTIVGVAGLSRHIDSTKKFDFIIQDYGDCIYLRLQIHKLLASVCKNESRNI